MERYFPPLKTNCSRCKDKFRPVHMLSFAHSELHSLFPVWPWSLGSHACMQALFSPLFQGRLARASFALFPHLITAFAPGPDSGPDWQAGSLPPIQ